MAHSQKHAKRLLAELNLPENPRKALQDPRYWDSTVLGLYLDTCDERIFHDPREGLRLAEIAPDLALLVPEGTIPTQRLEHREQLVRAYAVLGGGYRATKQLAQADEPYRLALKLAAATSPMAQADLFQRLATLRTSQGRYHEAIRLAQEAARTFKKHNETHKFATALAGQAFAYVEARSFSDALRVASEALCYSDPKVSPRTHYSAMHNFAYAAIHSVDLETLHKARAKIREARQLITHHRRSIPKFKLYWIEGILLLKLFATRRAEQLFEKARQGFLELDAVYECALATLDLSGLLFLQGQWSKLEVIAREAVERFCEVEARDQETIAALGLWLEAVEHQRLERVLLSEVRELLLVRMVKHRAGP